MSESTVCSVLRVVAVLVILVGAILSTQVLVTVLGVGAQFPGGIRGVAGPALLGQLSIATWGLVLYAASAKLAARIVE